MTLTPRVALSQQFLLELAKLPAAVHSRVVKWMLKFQQDPTSSGINYETIRGARDASLRSVRIDQDWRGIVFKPERGDLYVLLHLAHHDDAYRWAERRKLTINPATGAMQVVVLEDAPASGEPPAMATHAAGATDKAAKPLFAGITDEQMAQIGVPSEMLSRVRRIGTEEELDALQPDLPVEGYEGLFLILAGSSVNEILAERETRVDRKVDTEDFAAAIETPESQSRFVVLTDDKALAAILNAPLAQWRVFLHPTQRRLAIGDRSGPVRILGGAGTGKTVLAMHRAKWLAENRASDGHGVLFTTFTRNLALDVAHNMKTLITDPAVLQRLEVTNLDRWVSGFLRQHDYPHRIIYGRDEDAWGKALQLADPALGLDETFFAAEWEHVVLAQGVQDLDAYRQASRVGRGHVLTRSKRDKVWLVFEEYRALLSAARLKEVDDAYHDAAALLAVDKTPAHYVGIVVDETQDFGPQALRLLRAMIPEGPNDLFFVGDGHQRIYARHRAAMSRCGINIRGRARKLYLNYRTTDEIRRQAVALLEGRDIDDLDDGKDDNRRYKSLSHGAVPEMTTASSLEQAVADAVARVDCWRRDNGDGSSPVVCIMTATNRLCEQVASALGAKSIPTRVIDARAVDDADGATVRVSTMHRAKGLEFDRVVVIAGGPGVDKLDDDAARLLYVALTRAKSAATLIKVRV